MADTIDQNLWYKIRHTPLRDALRGRLTARLDLRRPLEEAPLPPPIKQLLRRVVKATRLWRLEQLEVQQELIAHFTDGIASGVPTDELIKVFGNERQAAQLIRRAKRRNRPLPWHTLRFATWAMAGLLVLYSGYAIYFFAGHPSPRINYVAIINSTVVTTPVEDRGWTFYRRALIGTDLSQTYNADLVKLNDLISGNDRTGLAEFVRTHQSEIAWVREGATKSQLGWVIGAKGSVSDAELWPDQKPGQAAFDESYEPLSQASLPPLSGLRYLAILLRADAIIAGQSGDAKRLLQDIDSSLNLSQQVGGKASSLLLSLVSIATLEIAMEDVERALREHPLLIEKEDLLALSRRLSGPKVAADLFSFEPERVILDDTLQRAFTDDGSGNGRFTSEGLFLRYGEPGGRWWKNPIQPVFGLLAPSRREFEVEYSQALDMAEANLHRAIRDGNWPNTAEVRPISPFSIAIVMPSYIRSQGAGEKALGHRDGVVTGIALELYRREHGEYPESLDALVPSFLTEVPIDRITGTPVHYRLVDGQPLVYSVGADRKDDNGRDPSPLRTTAVWDAKPDLLPDGDWVLYPTLRMTRPEVR